MRIGRDDLVKGGHGVPRTQFSGILFVIVEILSCQHPVFISDESVGLYFCGIKLNLDFNIFGNGKECRTNIRYEDFFRFPDIIDIKIISIPGIADLLHSAVFVIPHAKPHMVR